MVSFRGPLILHLSNLGHRVLAFAPDWTPALSAQIADLGAQTIHFPLDRSGINPIRDARTLAILFRLMRKHRVDTFAGFMLKPVVFGSLAAALLRVPRRTAVIEGAGVALTDTPGRERRRHLLCSVVSLLYRVALATTHRVVFLNVDDQREFIAGRLCAARKTAVVGPIGVDLKRFTPAPMPEGPMTFVFIGRLLREKGVFEFIHAARLAKAMDPTARFLIVGGFDTNPGAPDPTAFGREVTNSPVEWVGEQIDVRPWISRSHVFVLPSYREGFPRSTQEAMAMGRAIITTDVPGCRETVHDGHNGFVVAAHNAAALADAMKRFLREPNLARTFGERSGQLARLHFDAQSAAAVFAKHILREPTFP